MIRVRPHRRRTSFGTTSVVEHDRSGGKGVSDIGRAFWAGQRASGGGGKAAKVTSAPTASGKLILYEYGWAVLAERSQDGHVKIFDGWLGHQLPQIISVN